MNTQHLYKRNNSFDTDDVSGLKYTSPDYLVDLYKSKMKNVNSDLNVPKDLEDTTISYETINKRFNEKLKKQPEIENDPKILLDKQREGFDIDLKQNENNENNENNNKETQSSFKTKDEILNSIKSIIESKEILKILIVVLIVLLFYSMLKCQIYKYKLKYIKKHYKKK